MDGEEEEATVAAECLERIKLLPKQDQEDLKSQQIKKNDDFSSHDSGLDIKYMTEPNFETELEFNQPENIEMSVPSLHSRRVRPPIRRLRTMYMHPNELIRRIDNDNAHEEEKVSEVPSFI